MAINHPKMPRHGNGYTPDVDDCELKDNIRITEGLEPESIEDLAGSILAHGQLYPVEGLWDSEREKFIIHAGQRRYLAIILLKRTGRHSGKIQVETVKKDVVEGVNRIYRQFAHDIGTVVPCKADQAAALKKAHEEFKEPIAKIAEKIGKSDQWVRDMIAFATAPEHLKKAVADGHMKVTTAVKTVRATKAAQEEIREQVESGRSVKGRDVELANYSQPDPEESEQEEIAIEEVMMTREEISAQIKKADIRFCKAKSEKERIKWMSFKEAFRIVLKLARELT